MTAAARADRASSSRRAGWGGDAQGSAAVPGVEIVFGANHWNRALGSHALNFPDAEQGDIHDADLRAVALMKRSARMRPLPARQRTSQQHMRQRRGWWRDMLRRGTGALPASAHHGTPAPRATSRTASLI